VAIVRAVDQTSEDWREGVKTLLRVAKAHGAEALCLMDQWCDPGCGAPSHVHTGVEEVLLILGGSATVTLGEESVVASTGDAVVVSPGTWHSFTNASEEQLHILAVFADATPPVEYVDEPGVTYSIGAQSIPHRSPS